MKPIIALLFATFAAAIFPALYPIIQFGGSTASRRATIAFPLGVDIRIPDVLRNSNIDENGVFLVAWVYIMENNEGITCNLTFSGNDFRRYSMSPERTVIDLGSTGSPVDIANCILRCESSLVNADPNAGRTEYDETDAIVNMGVDEDIEA
ncbi:hypothetical protein JHW43_000019 [Diplocarpon mali]|nr:hypothetical protein JHW43_000019 [Diplocarpon mali]